DRVVAAREPSEQVEDRQVRLGGADELDALPERAAQPRAGPQVFGEALDEARLPEPWLAADEDDLPEAALRFRERPPQARELARAADEEVDGGRGIAAAAQAVAAP